MNAESRRPCQATGSQKVIAATNSSVDVATDNVAASQPRHRPHPSRCEHGTLRHRYCRKCIIIRRREYAGTKSLLSTWCSSTPQTFGLGAGELRSEANRLVGEGWSVDDVEAVLDVARRAS